MTRRILMGCHWNAMEGLHRGILRRCAELGWETALLTVETMPRVMSTPVSAVIGPLPERPDHPVLRRVIDADVPVLELAPSNGRTPDPFFRYPSDGTAVGRMAAEYLRRLPVASFCFVADSDTPANASRRNAFQAALAGDRRPVRAFTVNEERPDWSAELVAAFKTMPAPVGIWGSVDSCARLALRAALDAGLDVPGGAYILGYGNREAVCEFAPVPLSSIAIDYTAWGYAAMDWLAGIVEGRAGPERLRLFPPSGVVERASTVGVSPQALLCARAIALMRSLSGEAPSVGELAAQLHVSKSTLDRAFSAVHGTGAAQYGLRLRLDAAMRRLEAGEKATLVSLAAGFSSYRAFAAAFLRRFGRSPGAVRREG